MNKRADMNVMIMVFITLAVFLSMLFIFVTSHRGLVKNILNPEVINSVYLEKNLAEFYLKEVSEQALSNIKIKSEEEFLEEPFIEDFKNNFIQQLTENSHISYIGELKEKYNKGEIEITYAKEGRKLDILVKNYKIVALVSYTAPDEEINKIQEEFSKRYENKVKIFSVIPTYLHEKKMIKPLGIEYNPDIKISLNVF